MKENMRISGTDSPLSTAQNTMNQHPVMKYLLRILLAAVILAPTLARAELVLYKGIRKDTYTGEGYARALTLRMILVVDHDTAQAAALYYATIKGTKHYSTSLWTNTHFVQVAAARGSSTAIARPPTQCEIDSGSTGEGVYCAGPNRTLTVNTNSTIFFPGTLRDKGNGLFYSDTSGEPVLGDGSFHLVFDRASTVASNKAGESFDAALARLTAQLESRGYTP
jgi:hypothetical protein